MILTNPNIPNREVYCRDSIEYLSHVPDHTLQSVITSLPDAEEVGMSFEDWERWFVSTCILLFKKVKRDQYLFFYQTDRKREGGIIDKSYLVGEAAHLVGINQIFHKIVLKRDIGKIDLWRPAYTHLLCYSHKLKIGKVGQKIPDVFPGGEMLYKNAMGMDACKVCLDMCNEHTDTIFDPFCGMGSVLKMANSYGKKAVGIDILIDQCYASLDLPVIDFKLD